MVDPASTPKSSSLPGWLRSSSAHVFVADIENPRVDDEDMAHLGRVLRLRPGEVVSVSDGHGSLRECKWVGVEHLEVLGPVVKTETPEPVLTVAFSLTKGDKPEWTVQKLTEIGVDRIVIMASARTVVRWEPAKAKRQLERLRSVVRQASMQSRKAWLPEVEGVVGFDQLVSAGDTEISLAVPEAPSLHAQDTTVLVGPEGGWDPAEEGAVKRHVGLGSSILRAETAALAAAVLMVNLRAGSL